MEIFDNRKEDYIKAAFFGKEEQIKISLVSIIDQLAHIGKENGFKNKAIISGLNKRSSKDFEYSNDKVINEKTEYEAGSMIDIPSDPEKEGYTFTGWYKEGEDEEYNFVDNLVTEDVDLYSKYENTKRVYIESF